MANGEETTGFETTGFDTPRFSETKQAFDELMSFMSNMDDKFTDPEKGLDEQQLMLGYRWIFSILQVATDVYVWGDPNVPRFVDIVGPYKKWGGDNADAFYQFAPVDPRRTYRLSGTTGDAVYFSLTVYGGPNDGNYTERIVQTVNMQDLEIGNDGSFEFMMGPEKPAEYEGAFLQLEDDAVHALTRDYMMTARAGGKRVSWNIECLDDPGVYRLTDSDTARRLRAVKTWLEIQLKMVPVDLRPDREQRSEQDSGHVLKQERNGFAAPYPVPKVNYGWSAGDASYSWGNFDLAEDEAMVIVHTPPPAVFWNLCGWDPFLGAFNYDYERISVNKQEAVMNTDGSVTIVLAREPVDHPNGISTVGHPNGRLAFRWFLPEGLPDPVQTTVIKRSQVGEHLPS